MKVLIVNPHMHLYGGADIVIVKLANYLTNNGIQNALLTLSISDKVKNDLVGTEIIIPDKQKDYSKTSSSFIKEFFILKKYINKHSKDFDIINVHAFPAEIAILSCKKPVVWMCNEPPGLWPEMQTKKLSILKKFIYKIALETEKYTVKTKVTGVCVADEFNFSRLKRLYKIDGFKNNYGIDYNFFSKGNGEAIKRKYNLEKNFIIIQVALIIPFKNQLESIKTIEKLKNKIPNIKLILVGAETKPEYAKEIKNYIKQNNLGKYVLFTGNVSREEIRNLYKIANVSLMPIKSQGGWLAPFEALCSACPVVVSKEITCASIIKRENIGTVTNNYSETILDIYKNPTKHKKISEHGKNFVKNQLTWNKFSKRMLKCFEKAIQKE
jgi:glycosyltransferase involved in cell wall biosynthesis